MGRRKITGLSAGDQALVDQIPQEGQTNGQEAPTATKAKKVRTAYYMVMTQQQVEGPWTVITQTRSQRSAVKYIESVKHLLAQMYSGIKIVRAKTTYEVFLN